jgi:phasin
MNTNVKSKSGNVTHQLRDMTETGAERSKEAFETIGAATSEMANMMQNCCSTALKGMQEYNSKVLEFTQANTQSNVEFAQKLVGVKSPSEFIEVAIAHGRQQMETLGEQGKELTELARQMALAATEPLKSGFAKGYDRAALAPS